MMSEKELGAALLAKFALIVFAAIRDVPLAGTTIDKVLEASMIVQPQDELVQCCFLRLTLKEEVCAMDLCAIADRLDDFCGWEEGPGSYDEKVEVDGRKWVIGDGDDSGAVTFRDNHFDIWVRYFVGED